MNVIIVEDEKLAAERLRTLLLAYDPAIMIAAVLESIEDTIQYLKKHAHPDILFLDIHLSDGHCFEIFKQVNYNKPVIFTTAYDQYALEAFRLFSVDYILKPVTQESLALAINKLNSLAASFSSVDLKSLQPIWEHRHYKKRFLGKVGQRLFFIETQNIAFFQADNKIVYMVDKESNRYITDTTIEKLEALLDPKCFFRLNRRYIINIEAIQQIKPYYNSRLKLSVLGAAQEDEMIISRDKVSGFKKWALA